MSTLRTAALAALAGLAAAAPAAHADVSVEHESAVVEEAAGNGNGVLEPGESFRLTERLLSTDLSGTLTGVSGTLASDDPAVTVTTATASWPDLPFGVPTAAGTPFEGTIAATAPCGLRPRFTIAVRTDAGPATAQLSLRTGRRGGFASHAPAELPAPIVDGGSFGSSIEVDAPGRVRGVRVRLGKLTHGYMADLRLVLVAPDGSEVVLADGRGGSGAGFEGTVFDDDADASVFSGSAPFAGAHRPQEALSALEGQPLAGTWTLRVTDTSPGAAGALEDWSLELATAACDPPKAEEPPPPPPPPPAEPQHCKKPQAWVTWYVNHVLRHRGKRPPKPWPAVCRKGRAVEVPGHGHGHGHGHGKGHGRR